jgi:phosphatidylserine/phosphatidylglycerophosphate/cardiolipin synthase-like enzyme
MQRFLLALIPILVLLLSACSQTAQSQAPGSLPPIEIYFSPKGGCTDAIIKEVKAAKRSVLVQAYWFTSASIAKALVEAHKRGVKVEVILDRSRTEIDNEQADSIVQNDVPTFIDDKHTTAHSKVVIIDGQVVITGSFNFTDQAEEENVENLLVIRDKAIADRFTANWKAHAEHAGQYRKQ